MIFEFDRHIPLEKPHVFHSGDIKKKKKIVIAFENTGYFKMDCGLNEITKKKH